MLSPDYLMHVSEGAEQIAEELHRYIIDAIIKRMMARIGRGDAYLLTAIDKWQIETLQEAGYLLEDIQEEIVKATNKQRQEIKDAMVEAGVRALEWDAAIYTTAGLSSLPLEQSPELMRIMQRNYDATLGEWQNYTRTTANASQQVFIKAVDTAYNLTASGTVSYTQAVSEAVDQIVDYGVRVNYPTGHSDTIETATLRAVRTGISQMSGQVTEKRMEEMDWDIVLTSAHIGARTGDGGMNPGNHFWWQGQFFSRNGKTPHLPDFKSTTGYGTGEGLCGWNCRHSFGPGDGINNPYKDIDAGDNLKAEQLQMQQRLLERRIRKTKRAVQGLQEAVNNCTDAKLKEQLQKNYDRKAYLLSRQNKMYNDFCKQNDLKKLADRIRIAKWTREQAAKARGAATRYANAGK